MDLHATPVGHVERLIQSAVRWRLIFLIVAVVVPAGCYGIFERQARRLDALGDHGATATATVTAVKEGGTVDYAYVVDGTTYAWNVAREDAPYAVGETFPVTVLPEDPSLSLPGADRSSGTIKAASNRSFAWKLEASILAFFAYGALMCDVQLRRLRKTGQTERNDPQAYRTRLLMTGVPLVLLAVVIPGWHFRDALRRGESVWPVLISVLLCLAVLGGTWFYTLRGGRMQATARAARVLRWAAPLATGIATLRLIAWLMGWQ